jgi:hypothetical protein
MRLIQILWAIWRLRLAGWSIRASLFFAHCYARLIDEE